MNNVVQFGWRGGKPFLVRFGPCVDVYWNRTSSCFSVRHKESQKVIGHATAINLMFVELKVSQKGRLRQLETGHRTVHAYMRGLIVGALKPGAVHGRVWYNPKKNDSFMVFSPDLGIYPATSVSLLSCTIVDNKPYIQYA